MPPQLLRDYQQRGTAAILDAYRTGAKRVLMVLPTAGGKTTVFGSLAAQLKAPVLILVHRRELATQAANRLREFGVDFGFIMAGERRRPAARVQIASVQTLVRREGPRAGLIVIDEAHLSTAATYSKILEQYPDVRILGVTATPWRLSGKPLVGAYDSCVVVATPRELREQGHLCPYVGFSYLAPDLSAVETVGGEYNEKQSAEAMREPQIVANIVERWQAHASNLATVVFAVTVEHSQQLTEEFKAAGVRAEHLDGSTPKQQRAAILGRVDSGVTQVLCNVGVAVEGLDIPRLKCIVLARPTKSLARFIQMAGRGRRPWQGLTCRIHDHAFSIRLHGLPDADRDYTLSSKPVELPSLTQCETCLALYTGRACPACGGENEVAPTERRELATVADAEAFEFSSDDEVTANAAAARKMMPPVRIDWRDTGKVVEGIFREVRTAKTQWGEQRLYRLEGTKRDYDVPGTQVLDHKMRNARPGDKLRITFTSRTVLGGGKERKEFTVEVDR